MPPKYWDINNLSSSIIAAARAVNSGSVLKKRPDMTTDVNFSDSI